MRTLFLGLVFTLSAAAVAQSGPPYAKIILYERAAREPHADVYHGAPINYNTGLDGLSSYTCDASAADFFTVTGDAAQGNLPWGTTWKNLCDNHWTFSKTVTGCGVKDSESVDIIHDFYTIDGNYSEPDPDHPGQRKNYDSSNGMDDICNDPNAPPPYCNGHWTRTCTSSVTNDFYGKVVKR